MVSRFVRNRTRRFKGVAAGIAIFLSFLPLLCEAEQPPESVCFGTPEQGRLENGWKLPAKGENFVAYSSLGRWLGRTYVHSRVYQTIVDAYQALAEQSPSNIFVYGETGWKSGGSFKPHKTHQNGTSVDFMVPVVNAKGESVPLPTNIMNKLGYGIDFDDNGVFQDYRIDFEAIGKHLRALVYAARRNGVGIRRVIFDPKLRPYLFKTQHSRLLMQQIRFSRKPSWVRHDDHYHIDFQVGCEALETDSL